MTTFRGRGRVGPCHGAVGEGSFRFTGAFSRGWRFFSSSNLAVHPPGTISKFYLAAGRRRRGHHLSMQPVDQVGRSLTGLGPSWFPCFAIGIGRMGCSAMWSRLHILGRFARFDGLGWPVILGFPSLLGKAGFLPGVALHLLLALRQAFTRGITFFFSCTRRRGEFRLEVRRSSLPPDREVACFKVSRKALTHQFTGRQGSTSAVAFLIPRRGALCERVPQMAGAKRFHRSPSFHRSTDRRSVPQRRGIKDPNRL